MSEELIKTLTTEQDSPPWLHERIILLSEAGSSIYGTSLTPEEDPIGKGSDTDYRGVCIPPKSYFFGLEKFQSFDNTGGKNFKSTHETKDVAIMHVTKFVLDAIQSVPNNLELLYVPKDKYVVLNVFGRELIDFRDNFLNKEGIKRKFGGYSKSQKINMRVKSTRQDLVDMFGYDPKFFMHACRLLLSATELLSTGTMTLPMPQREWLKECRKGKYTYDEAVEVVDDLDDKMNEAYNKSALPDLPDFHKINDWLCRFNEAALTLNW